MIDYKKLIDSLSDENITKKSYDTAVNKINNRVDEIWRYICKVTNIKLHWWSFSNDEYDGEGNGSSGGCFDPKNDIPYIQIIGERTHSKLEDCIKYEYCDGFPIGLLWDENWKNTIKNHIEEIGKILIEEKKKNAEKRALKKKKDSDMKALVKKKLAKALTKEELKYVKIK